jgi:hypothetical protein
MKDLVKNLFAKIYDLPDRFEFLFGVFHTPPEDLHFAFSWPPSLPQLSVYLMKPK